MLTKKTIEEVKEFEKAGIDVVVIGSAGTLDYSTQRKDSNDYCDNCCSFRLYPDPDPFDSFRCDDMKAVCLEVKGVLRRYLETPSEWTNLPKPLFCPKLGRTLSKEEQEQAKEQLEKAKKKMNE